MVSSTTTTSSGAPFLISAMARAIEVGVRDQAFCTRAFCAASSACFCAAERVLARPRRRAVDAGGRLPQRLERRIDVGDDAGIDGEVVGQARRRGFDLQHLAARRERRAGRVPDFLEERPAHHQHEVVVGELLGDARRIEGERAAPGGMIGRKGIAAAQALEPHRGADALDQLLQGPVGAGARHVVAGHDGRVLRGDDQPRHRLDAGRIGTARRIEVRGLAGPVCRSPAP